MTSYQTNLSGGTVDERDPIERVKQSEGDLVLDFSSRIGARPYARYVDGEWDVMSLSGVPTPQYGEPEPDSDHPVPHNTEVHTVDLEPDPIPEDELREMARHPRGPDDDAEEWAGVEVIDVEESPFPDRDEIPTRDEIVWEADCDGCGEQVRVYRPDPQHDECPHCGAELPEDVPAASEGQP